MTAPSRTENLTAARMGRAGRLTWVALIVASADVSVACGAVNAFSGMAKPPECDGGFGWPDWHPTPGRYVTGTMQGSGQMARYGRLVMAATGVPLRASASRAHSRERA